MTENALRVYNSNIVDGCVYIIFSIQCRMFSRLLWCGILSCKRHRRFMERESTFVLLAAIGPRAVATQTLGLR